MNTANLQLEGLYLAFAAITKALVRKGVLSAAELEDALKAAESVAIGGNPAANELSPSNRDAVLFPIRLLALANRAPADVIPDFYTLAKEVGATKPSNQGMR